MLVGNYPQIKNFKRGDLGKYIGIEDIRHNFKDFPSHYTLGPRSRGVGRLPWEDEKSS